MLLGWADPIGLLALHGPEFAVAQAVVETAQAAWAEREKDRIEALARSIGGEVARHISTLFG